jgi:hypothetical protein
VARDVSRGSSGVQPALTLIKVVDRILEEGGLAEAIVSDKVDLGVVD